MKALTSTLAESYRYNGFLFPFPALRGPDGSDVNGAVLPIDGAWSAS